MTKTIYDIETTQISGCHFIHKTVLDYSVLSSQNSLPIFYIIKYGTEFSWTYRFNTFGNHSNSDIDILLFSDNQYKRSIFEPLLHTISSTFGSKKPNFIIHVGDFTQVTNQKFQLLFLKMNEQKKIGWRYTIRNS